MELARKDEGLAPGREGVERRGLEREPETLADLVGLRVHVDAVDADRPLRRVEQGRQDADRRGLAGAVRSEQAEERAPRDVERDAIDRAGGGLALPVDLDEAADLDGASSWQKFRYIIFPGIKQIVGLSLILAVSGALSVFEIPFIMTSGANGSETFVIQTVDTAFRYSKVGLASAMAVVLLIIVLVISAIQRKFFPDEKGDLV